ncbi:hypothetical protein [Cryobacterium frigoriphilum]|nr:hypothetical protein [Cryobacterium frigoriphilum]
MKSSLARTFADHSAGQESHDRIFPLRATTREIRDQSGAEIPSGNVVVIQSYDEQVGPTETTSTLLVNKDLRDEYEQIQSVIEVAKANLVAALGKQSGSRKDVAKEISRTFTDDEASFFLALSHIRNDLRLQEDLPFADLPYDRIFDDKVVALLETAGFRSALGEYISRYNELLDSSTYFSRQTFNYYNAANVTKNLADNGFFRAHHSVLLNSETPMEVVSQAELQKLIDTEKAKISGDDKLRKKLADVEKQINKNVTFRDFHAYLSNHEDILPLLENVGSFRQTVWKSYIKKHSELLEVALAEYEKAEERKRQIEGAARGQQTQWEKVISIFNDRFFVPFRLKAENREEVVLGREPLLRLGFDFEDRGEIADVDKGALLEVLSTGEKKALYILNVLFEIETRKGSENHTLFVIDDLADSFDYKNKYAIIQYLKEISSEPKFRQIILTHNFDFFRTIESRFVGYGNCLMAQKSEAAVRLVQAAGIKNPFITDWKGNFFESPMKRIASIPFLRNILEYTKGEEDPGYQLLTSLLHWKVGTSAIAQESLDDLFASTFGVTGIWKDPDEFVVDEIFRQATICLVAETGVNFENKIVMSIAIRLTAERYMVEQIADPSFTDHIAVNQTAALLKRYRQSNPANVLTIRTLEGVMLMTPENIHVNSFMYEPILDMSDEHLRRLYLDVEGLALGEEPSQHWHEVVQG